METAERAALTVGGHVWHVETGTMGSIREVYESGRYVGENGRTVTSPVVKLDTGDAFVWTREAFVEVTPEEGALYKMIAESVSTGIAQAAALFERFLQTLSVGQQSRGPALFRAAISRGVRA